MSPVTFVGERKGSLCVIVRDEFSLHNDIDAYQADWQKLTDDVGGDYWHTQVYSESQVATSGIMQERGEKLMTYLHNIHNLWSLGIQLFKSEVQIIQSWVTTDPLDDMDRLKNK